MKVRELIEQLNKQDPEKEVFIQQGEEHDYMVAYSVKEKELLLEDNLLDEDNYDNRGIIRAVVIEYW